MPAYKVRVKMMDLLLDVEAEDEAEALEKAEEAVGKECRSIFEIDGSEIVD